MYASSKYKEKSRRFSKIIFSNEIWCFLHNSWFSTSWSQGKICSFGWKRNTGFSSQWAYPMIGRNIDCCDLGISTYLHKMEITIPFLRLLWKCFTNIEFWKALFVDRSFCTCFTHCWRCFAGGNTEAQNSSSFLVPQSIECSKPPKPGRLCWPVAPPKKP